MKKIILVLVLFLSACSVEKEQELSTLDSAEGLSWLSQKVFLNETGGDDDNLVFWSENEGFMSLGIAHFIWYPEGQRDRYKETFPHLIDYFKAANEPLPEWLAKASRHGAPWQSREAFITEQDSPRVHELKDLLSRTMALQARFMAQRLRKALPEITAYLGDDQDKVIARYQAIETTDKGLYLLLDYVNFKGEGTSLAERYQGQGWGLLQVLQSMPDVEPGDAALDAFANAAEMVLTRRVNNAPVERGEQRWLRGWLKRVDSYRAASL